MPGPRHDCGISGNSARQEKTMLKKIKGVLVSSIAAPLAFVGTSALAAVPADVTTAITDMKADALTIASAFLVATIAVIAFLYMRKGAR
jgi:hypothetical protein